MCVVEELHTRRVVRSRHGGSTVLDRFVRGKVLIVVVALCEVLSRTSFSSTCECTLSWNVLTVAGVRGVVDTIEGCCCYTY